MEILGIDVGGTGIKAAPVDLSTGTLLAERNRIDTPRPAKPEALVEVIKAQIDFFNWTGPVGCGFPTVVVNGTCRTASNLHKSWVGVDIQKLFSDATGLPFKVINDADAAGLASMKFGLGKDLKGKVLFITIGTGIGSGLFQDGVLIPNLELGRINSKFGEPIENYTSKLAMKKDNLSIKKWAKRFDYFLHHIDLIISPEHVIIGGGMSKRFDEFKDYLTVDYPVQAAVKKNNAGIIGAALAASEGS